MIPKAYILVEEDGYAYAYEKGEFLCAPQFNDSTIDHDNWSPVEIMGSEQIAILPELLSKLGCVHPAEQHKIIRNIGVDA